MSKNENSKFMAGRATSTPAPSPTKKKRIRGPRVSTSVTGLEFRRLKKRQKVSNCDASHLLHAALIEMLARWESGIAPVALEAEAHVRALRQVVTQATFLFQNENWARLRAARELPLKTQFDVDILGARLAEIESNLDLLVRRVAALLTILLSDSTFGPAHANCAASPASSGESMP